MDAIKIGIREFREQLASLVESEQPIAVTKHGRTVGLYIPVRRKPEVEDLQALREAGRTLDAWMAEHGVKEEDLVSEFDQARKAARRRG